MHCALCFLESNTSGWLKVTPKDQRAYDSYALFIQTGKKITEEKLDVSILQDFLSALRNGDNAWAGKFKTDEMAKLDATFTFGK